MKLRPPETSPSANAPRMRRNLQSKDRLRICGFAEVKSDVGLGGKVGQRAIDATLESNKQFFFTPAVIQESGPKIQVEHL